MLLRYSFLLAIILLQFNLHAQKKQTSIEKGKASFYANKFEGRRTASGEIYHHKNFTAAHKSLPFGTWVKVVNKDNNKSVIVRINDRGPFVKGRIIDLSKSAAKEIGNLKQGVFLVTVRIYKKDRKAIRKMRRIKKSVTRR